MPPAQPSPSRPARRRVVGRLGAAAAWAGCWPSLGQSAGRTLTAGVGERWRTLHDAARAAADGDTIELQPGVYRADVTVLTQRRLTLRGLAGGAVLLADGHHAEGKAIVVVRGDVHIQNIEFRGCRVPSGNGAGIRFESGRLALTRCRFFDNEMGLLSASAPAMVLDIVDCEFGQAPRHEGLLHHLLYVGAIGAFSVCGSRFEQGWRGHLLKSRARINVVRGNWLVDGPGGQASYELEFPDGGDNLVAGNVIVQSALTQNATVLSMGAEAGAGSRGRLLMLHNTLVNLAGGGGRFVQVWSSRLPAETPGWIVNNVFAGPGQLLMTGQHGGGNQHVNLSHLRDAAHGDYRLGAPLPLSLPDAAAALAALTTLPPLEFTAPVGSRAFPDAGARLPGALQTRG